VDSPHPLTLSLHVTATLLPEMPGPVVYVAVAFGAIAAAVALKEVRGFGVSLHRLAHGH
jgi:hypothetical protein